jgi:plastocyanin
MTIRRLVPAFVLMLAAALIVGGCAATSTEPVTKPVTNGSTESKTESVNSSNTPAMPGHTIVTITDTGFNPAEATIKVGEKIVWRNDGKETHAVVFDDGSVTSPDIAPGTPAVHAFDKAGTYAYHCSKHPDMKGVIVVKKK